MKGVRSESVSKSNSSANRNSMSVSELKGLNVVGIKFESKYTQQSGQSRESTTSSNLRVDDNWSNSYMDSKSSSKGTQDSKTQSKSVSINKGAANGKAYIHGSASSEENRKVDSISITKEAGRSLSEKKSNEKSINQAKSKSLRIDDSFESSKETSITETLVDQRGITRTNLSTFTRSTARTVTIGQTTKFFVPGGECRVAVSMPLVKSIAIPYECVSYDKNNQRIVELAHVEYMIVGSKDSIYTYSAIDCHAKDQKYYFKPINRELENANELNSIVFGEPKNYGTNGELITSHDGKYKLVFQKDGNLVIKEGNRQVWANDMGYFKPTIEYPMRLRINEKGHLVQEVKNLFSETVPNYRSDEWITVWSTAPINHNVTIGMPKVPSSRESYRLILISNEKSKGVLMMYDAAGAMIWCSSHYYLKQCQHGKGYKFPEVYLVPTNFDTPEVPNDKHNSISDDLTEVEKTIKSLDVNCDALHSNETIIRGKYKLILESTGNLIIKDSYRTMWESASGYLAYSTAPYKMVIAPTGNIYILDNNNFIVWMSVISYLKPIVRPFTLKLLDIGKLIVEDSANNTIWESWPTRDLSYGMTMLTGLKYNYEKCFPPTNKKILKSSPTDDRKANSLFANQMLLSSNLLHTLRIVTNGNRSDLVFRNIKLFQFDRKINRLTLENDGDLVAYDQYEVKVWTLGVASSNDTKITSPYTLKISNKGLLSIQNERGSNVWSYPFDVKITELNSDDRNILFAEVFQQKMTLNSTNNEWSVFIKNNSLIRTYQNLQYGNDIFRLKSDINSIRIRHDGVLIALLNDKNKTEQKLTHLNLDKRNGPFKLALDNNGVLMIKDGKNKPTSWKNVPVKKMDSLNTNKNNLLAVNQILKSKNKFWELVISEASSLLIKYKNDLVSNILYPNQISTQSKKLKHLKLENDSKLALYDDENNILQTYTADCELSQGPYSLIIDDHGNLVVSDSKLESCEVKISQENVFRLSTDSINGLVYGSKNRLVSKNKKWFLGTRKIKNHYNFGLFKGNQIETVLYNKTGKPEILILENDGNLVLYGEGTSNKLWSSNTAEPTLMGAYNLELSDDGILTLKNKLDCEIWRFGGSNVRNKIVLSSDEYLVNGERLRSDNGKWEIVLSEGHRLTLINENQTIDEIYSEPTKRFCSLRLSSNGLLALYDNSNLQLWSNNIQADESSGPYKLILTNNGELQVTDYEESGIYWQYEPKPRVVESLKSDAKNFLSLNERIVSPNRLLCLTIVKSNEKFTFGLMNVTSERFIRKVFSTNKIMEKLIIRNDGNLILLGENKTVWTSGTEKMYPLDPYTLTVSNFETVVLKNSHDQISWKFPRSKFLNNLTSSGENKMYAEQRLRSTNNKWTLTPVNGLKFILSHKGGFESEIIYNNYDRKFEYLKLAENGALSLHAEDGNQIWTNEYQGNPFDGPFTFYLDNDDGTLVVLNKNDKSVWNLTVTNDFE